MALSSCSDEPRSATYSTRGACCATRATRAQARQRTIVQPAGPCRWSPLSCLPVLSSFATCDPLLVYILRRLAAATELVLKRVECSLQPTTTTALLRNGDNLAVERPAQ